MTKTLVKLNDETSHHAHTSDDEVKLTKFVSRILEIAKNGGASAAEVTAGDDIGLEVKMRDGDLDTVEFSRDRGFDITVYRGNRRGNASTTDTREESINEAVGAALAIAEHTEEDSYSGLADRDRLAVHIPDLDLYRCDPMDLEQLKQAAHTAESTALDFDAKIYRSDGARASVSSSCVAYGNSLGFLHAYRASSSSLYTDVIAKSDNGMQRAAWFTMARQRGELDSPEKVGTKAAQHAIRKLDPRPIPTGEYPVLFDQTVAMGLIFHLLNALSGRPQYLKSTYLLNSLEKQVATPDLSLKEYPLLPGAMGSRAYDSEGVATSEKYIVKNGIAHNYLLSSYSGRKLGMPTTGNASGVCNLTVEAETSSISDILKQMDRGLVVTSLMGQGVNVLTGDYSRGASGYWVENGEYTHAVDELTIAGNLDDMYKNMVAFGDDVEIRRNIRTGSVLISSMTVAAN